MNTQVSTPIKIFAAVGGVLILGLLGMTMLQGGGSSPSAPATTTPVATHAAPPATAPTSTAPTPATTHPVTSSSASPVVTKPAAKAGVTKKHAATKTAAAAKAPTHTGAPVAAKPAATRTKAKAKAKRTPAPAVAPDGLPTPLDVLLHIHRAVVVAVWDPEVPTDKLLVDEAKAGAAEAHAGFLAVSVLNEKVAAPLTAAAGGGSLLPSPGLLIYKQPSTLMNVISGFIDRAGVAGAVANALTASAPAAGTPTAPATTTTPAASTSTPTTTP